ncbi:hypothetical protein [Nocardia altamirensis]|uniref:hypothetical protein n=1 Tax=Nocardia altamirensis TaxID=472158 RepID=UPI0008404B78|nr:hypothetical protein [Nocardia altamirensis]
MTDILQADNDALRALGKDLTGHADVINKLVIGADVTMPGSPILEVTKDIREGAVAAFQALGQNIVQMSQVTTSGAKAYEDVERLFSDHFKRLQGELPS